MISITDLSRELVELVFLELYRENQPLLPLKNLNLKCRAFHVLATSLIFEHVILILTGTLTTRTTDIIAALEGQATIRSHVRKITIPLPILSSGEDNSRALQSSFRKILPLLPRLESIRLGGDVDTFQEYESLDLRSMQFSLLNTIAGLKVQPSLDVDCYVPNVCWSTLPDQSRCLNSVSVRMSGYWPNSSVPNSPSDNVIKLISQNPALHSLHLYMGVRSFYGVERNPTERTYALEHIGSSIRQLHSLTLDGDFHFTDNAWVTWSNASIWEHIQALTISKLSLIIEFTSRCTDNLPSLRTLKLSAYTPGDLFPLLDNTANTASISNFLASLQLENLSLDGFHPDILVDGLKPTLRYVRFHIRESTRLVKTVGGSDRSILRLSTKHIDTLRSTCPNLYWLGLDIESDVLHSLDDPATNSTTPASPTASNASAKSLTSSNNDISRPPPSPQHDQTELLQVLDMLATIRSLCHIRIFFYGEPVPKAMPIFTYLRTCKQGFPLRSLIIRTRSSVTIVWELGLEMAVLEYHQYTTRFREIWDAVKMSVRSREATSVEGWIGHPIWGCPEGW